MQAGPRWRVDVFLFLKWVWLSRLYRRLDSGDTPPPVRVLRPLERDQTVSQCKATTARASKPLTGCKARFGHRRFSRKTGRAAQLPFLIKRATSSPYFRTSPGAGVGLGAPELSFSAGICDLAGACPLVAAPDASGIVAAGPVLVPFCWGWGAPELSYCFGVCCCADATPALMSNAMLANTTKCFLMIRSSFSRCCRICRS